MIRLNPYAAVQRRNAILTEEKRKREKQILMDKRRGVSYMLWKNRKHCLNLGQDPVQLIHNMMLQ